MNDTNKKWYVAYVSDQKKASALPSAIRSAAHDSAVWVPTEQVYLKTDSNFGSKIIKVVRPLFPKYVFININLSSANLEELLKSTCGGYLLKAAGSDNPTALTEEEIAHIKELVEEHGNPQSVAESYDFELNQKVEITEGPFQGMVGRLKGIKKKMVIVELSIMGQDVSTEIEPSACSPISE